jgi:hypothetical protein
MSADEPTAARFPRFTAPRQPAPGEVLWEFVRRRDRRRFRGLVRYDHDAACWEAQFFKNDVLFVTHGAFATEADAKQYAARVRTIIERPTPARRRFTRPKTEITAAPPETPPSLICRRCDRELQYLHSYLAGPFPREQWDRFHCHRCGAEVEYRQRTKAVRAV